MSCQLGRPRTGGACAVCLHGTSFPPLVLGSGTPNLSPRSRRRRAPSGATALPEARLRTFPRTLRRTAAARGREPVEDPRAEEPGESALLPSLPHSPPRSLPPSPRMFRYESLEDCPLDEDEDAFQGLGEEDEEIDQFNDDTFGSGAVDDDWQEAHERLAELEEKLPMAVNEQTGNGERDEMDLLGDHEENLAERLSKMVIENELEDPAIMRAVQTRPVLQPQPGSLNSSIWDGSEVLRRIRGPLLSQEMPTVSVLEYALPQRPPQGPEDDRDLSERALPRRSTSPIIGSPPVRAVPIGTPPKQMAVPSFNQQNSSLLGHPFAPSVPPVLSPLQRAQLLGGAQLQPGRMSPSQFARVPGFVGSPLAAMNPKLLQGRVGQMLPPAPGFRAFFSAPPTATPPPQQHPPGPGPHLQNLRSQAPMFRPDTTHLHPQHRRLLHQRQQQNRNQHRNLNGAGDRGSHRSSHQDYLRKDPYANLMLQREKDWVSKIQMMQLQSTDPYLDDFYYQNYFEKLEKLSAAEEMQGDGPKKERTKLITPQVAKLEHAYKPVQFEGSLGKLTVSSVNNPRKMIDAVVTSRSEDDETKEKQVRDKRRKTLVIIEKTYSLLLDVEDYERRYLLSLEEERPALINERKHKICSMYDNLRGKLPGQERPTDDHFVQIMCIRKGKRMVARILPFLSTEQAADILMTTARNLPFLIKKDAQDEVLPCLLSPFSLLLYHLPSVTVTSLLQQLMNLPQSAAAPAPSNPHLTAVLQNKFGLSLLLVLLSRGEDLQSSDPTKESMQNNQWTEVMFMATRELLRIPQAALAKPISIPTNLVSLFSRYVDRQKLNLLETKLQLVQGIR
uniref:Protein PAT1 homolog 1 n=1 Tax=Castor canadensis TaxID=51338 RepID=A0A8C0WX14_CASCN